MKTLTTATMVLVTALLGPPALAQDKAACFTAAASAQTLRDAHRLVEAREPLRQCAAAACPPAVQTDCSGWLADVERAIPTIVLDAKDASGNDVFDVSVSADGNPLVEKLDGVAIGIDPGPHTFRFRWADGATVDRQVLVAEGQKALVVSVTRAAPAPAPTPAPPARAEPEVPIPSTRSNGLVTAGLVAGGAGLASLVVASVLGGVTFAEVGSAKAACGAKGCTGSSGNSSPVAVGDMQAAGALGNTSTALFVVGGTLAAGGLVLLWVGRPRKVETAWRLNPELATRGAGVALRAAW